MSVYLHDIPLEQAQQRFREALERGGLAGTLGSEYLPLDEKIIGRLLADPVWAKISSPHYHASAMDGYAVRAEETSGAMITAPLTLVCGKSAEYLDTGDPLPSWANAVIPIEEVEPLDEAGHLSAETRKPSAIRIRSAVTPWHYVRSLGEDIVATELVLPAGHTLRPVDLGAIAACGHSQVCVQRRPRVAILPTGSELVPIGEPVQAGDIIEYNSLVLAAQVNAWGGRATRLPITADDIDQIRERVRVAAREHDLVLLLAGSSAGSEDYSESVVESLGEVLVHGIALRPGHPVILGMIKVGPGQPLNVPVIGVPGYPVSAALTGEIFVKPLLRLWTGQQPELATQVRARLTRKVTSPAGDDDYMRVAVGVVDNQYLAAPLPRGAGVITSLVRADGIVVVPRGSQGLPAGAEVNVNLYRTVEEIKQTIFAIGSHDLTLDILAQHLSAADRRLASTNVGSLGGLVALRRNQAHLAGSHLLDPETGDFNLSYIRQYLPGLAVKVISLVGREQGLLVSEGNPLGIRKLEDLTRSDVTFVNRQRGSGTRVLLDYHLGILGIEPEMIMGYNQDEYTHLAVAAAIASGRADCGLGIAAAAQALGMDFVPLFQERYDLVIPMEYFNSDLLAPLLELLQDSAFRNTVAALPGYDVEPMGVLIADIYG
jgi:putative molybdopterin biosynthesis protein